MLQGEQAAVVVTVVAPPPPPGSSTAAAASHGLCGAVLHLRATHAESRFALALSLAAPEAAAAAGRGGGSGAAAGTSEDVALGDLAPAEQRRVVLHLDARRQGEVELTAELKVSGWGGGGGGLSLGRWEGGESGRAVGWQLLQASLLASGLLAH